MEIEPSGVQRRWQAMWIRVAPHHVILRFASKSEAASFAVYLFVRWAIVLFWVLPVLFVTLMALLIALPFLVLWTIQRTIWRFLGKTKDPAWALPTAVFVDLAQEAVYLALMPDVWIEKQF